MHNLEKKKKIVTILGRGFWRLLFLFLEFFMFMCMYVCMREIAPPARFMMLGQTHVNGWSRVVASQNGGSTSYIFPFRLRVLQWSRHLFNYWKKNKKTII